MNNNRIKRVISSIMALAAIQSMTFVQAGAVEAKRSNAVSYVSSAAASEAKASRLNTPVNIKDTISISNCTSVPSSLAKGKGVTVKGTITSASSDITGVTVGVYDESGKMVTGKIVYPNTRTFNLSALDEYILFNKLDAGTYNFKVYASNATVSGMLLSNQKFTVKGISSELVKDTISISGGTEVPAKLAKGEGLIVKGVVKSVTSNINELTVGVFDANGSMITGKTVNPAVNSYNINKLDKYVLFDGLNDGSYSYKVIASNSSVSDMVLVEKKFTVGTASSPSQTEDTMSISGGTAMPSSIKKGTPVVVKGTVKSVSSKITALTVGVYNVNGTLIHGKTVYPNAMSYNVNRLDAAINFDSLDAGTYYYKVTASNGSVKDSVLVNQKFTVAAASSSGQANDTLSISSGTVVPEKVSRGRGVIVKGTVKSVSSEITELTVGVYNESGKILTGKTVNPNAKSYNLGKLDAFVLFDSLDDGTYYYKVIASNAGAADTVLTNQKFTVGSGVSSSPAQDTLSVSNGTTVPASIVKGYGVIVKGTAKSASSQISELTVGIYDKDGKMMSGRTVNPNAKSYNLNKLDSYVLFSDLDDGEYYYKVIASNAAASDSVLVNQKFSVGNFSIDVEDKDVMTISCGTNLSDIKKGSSVTVKGTVKSESSAIISLTAGVYDENGSLLTGRRVYPYTASYNLSFLDNDVKFHLLPEGTYHYRVIATNDTNCNVILTNQEFEVK
ncbi:MAG: hypothetical protein IJX77_04060 [Ruminococcus sp.]|nr:hypothetical protein [Ruminococcus sp.]